MAFRQHGAAGLELIDEAAAENLYKTISSTQALDILQRTYGEIPDKAAAREEAIKQLRVLPGILDAGAAPNGIDLWVLHESGIELPIMMNRRGGATPTVLAQPILSARSFRRMALSTDDIPRRAVIFKPVNFDGGSHDEAQLIADILAAMQRPRFAVESYSGSQATIDALKQAASAEILVIVSHGIVTGRGAHGIMTGEVITQQSILQRREELHEGRYFLPYEGQVWWVTPKFFSSYPSKFNNTLVYGGTCDSYYNADFADAFLVNDAAVFYGYDKTVSSDFAANTGEQLFCGLLFEGKNSDEAYLSIDPKQDPNLQFAKFLKGSARSVSFVPPGAQPDLALDMKPSFSPGFNLFKDDFESWMDFDLGLGTRRIAPGCLDIRYRTAKSNAALTVKRPTGETTDETIPYESGNATRFTSGQVKLPLSLTSDSGNVDTLIAEITKRGSSVPLGRAELPYFYRCERPHVTITFDPPLVKPTDLKVTAKLEFTEPTDCALKWRWGMATNSFIDSNEQLCAKLIGTPDELANESTVEIDISSCTNNPAKRPQVYVQVAQNNPAMPDLFEEELLIDAANSDYPFYKIPLDFSDPGDPHLQFYSRTYPSGVGQQTFEGYDFFYLMTWDPIPGVTNYCIRIEANGSTGPLIPSIPLSPFEIDRTGVPFSPVSMQIVRDLIGDPDKLVSPLFWGFNFQNDPTKGACVDNRPGTCDLGANQSYIVSTYGSLTYHVRPRPASGCNIVG